MGCDCKKRAKPISEEEIYANMLKEKQNEILKNYLQQYYDGFHVNNVVMTNENPLLVVNKINPNPNYYVIDEGKEAKQPVQEGNKIVKETRKQKYLEFVPAH